MDVKLRDHKRAAEAGSAMSTWLWALLYAREQETDGLVPAIALRGAWVGEKTARKDACTLVAVGLWEAAPDGWRICRYAEHNETRAAIAARREEAKQRMQRVRSNKMRTHAEPRESEQRAVPGSRSLRDVEERNDPEGLGKTSGVPGGPVVDMATSIPDAFQAAADAELLLSPEQVDVAFEWRKYLPDRRKNGIPVTVDDWRGWVLKAIGFAKRDRMRESERREREAARAAERRPSGPEVRYPMARRPDDSDAATPEQHKAFAAELQRRLEAAS
ncbi:MAG TPA: hypothetical protein VEA38_06425 [Terriglobales bacterium]|nr:hypothetical protein [Terriglobales bacterium]